jgi:electron transfer flavoprotein alpha subunit
MKEEKDIKINEIDANELINCARIESEIMVLLRSLDESKRNTWKRIASQFNFDIEKDIASLDHKTKTISISRFNHG